MPTTQIVVPAYNDPIEVQTSFNKEISTILAEGNDVQFVTSAGKQASVNLLFIGSAGSVRLRGPDASSDTVTLPFAEQGWHRQTIGMIYADGTTAGIGLHVKMYE